MIEIRPHSEWTDETARILRPAIEIDPLADILAEAQHVKERRITLFNVYDGEHLTACFTGSIETAGRGDEFVIHAAASKEGKPVTMRVVSEFDALAEQGLCGAIRTTLYNHRLMPVFRRAGYRPIAVVMRKEI